MNTDLARAEMIAAALPRDFAQDMHDGKVQRNVCERCLHYFIGRPYRTLCALCAPRAAP